MKILISGFRFGILLQIAIGPVCLYILKTAVESGVIIAMAAVVAATLVDALFVILAILGIGVLLEKSGIKSFLKYIGALILAYFGLGIILGSLGLNIIPGISNMASSLQTTSAFITCFVLTASSPLTILFWAGVFATKMTHEGYGEIEMVLFGSGAVLTTLIFLGTVALVAGLLQPIITTSVLKVLNVVVGIVLIGFAAKVAYSKVSPSADRQSGID